MLESPGEDELRLYKARSLFYKKIVERYAEAVNAGEQKTIPELKLLVNPEDAAVASLKNRFLQEMQLAQSEPPGPSQQQEGAPAAGREGGEHYRFERDFIGFAERAFQFVQSLEKIRSELGVSFWLSPSEAVQLGVADAFDRCILLCSLLIAGGCENARVRVLELEGGGRHPVVVFYYKEKQYLMDGSQEASALTFTGVLEEIFKSYTFEGKRVLRSAFEFNNADYNEFE